MAARGGHFLFGQHAFERKGSLHPLNEDYLFLGSELTRASLREESLTFYCDVVVWEKEIKPLAKLGLARG